MEVKAMEDSAIDSMKKCSICDEVLREIDNERCSRCSDAAMLVADLKDHPETMMGTWHTQLAVSAFAQLMRDKVAIRVMRRFAGLLLPDVAQALFSPSSLPTAEREPIHAFSIGDEDFPF
jgi:hypothetical protein